MRRMNLDTPNLLDDFTWKHVAVLCNTNLHDVRSMQKFLLTTKARRTRRAEYLCSHSISCGALAPVANVLSLFFIFVIFVSFVVDNCFPHGTGSLSRIVRIT